MSNDARAEAGDLVKVARKDRDKLERDGRSPDAVFTAEAVGGKCGAGFLRLYDGRGLALRRHQGKQSKNAPALAASRTLPLGVLSLLLVPGAGSSLWLSQSSLALFTGLLPLLIPAGFRSRALRPRKE